jgi:hypothetical protein
MAAVIPALTSLQQACGMGDCVDPCKPGHLHVGVLAVSAALLLPLCWTGGFLL